MLFCKFVVKHRHTLIYFTFLDMHNHHGIDACDCERSLPEFNLMQTVKRRFYAMRNGALAGQMRSRGLDYRINFGLNLPQIKEIAADVVASVPHTKELIDLSMELWANEATRESRLMAPMIFPADVFTRQLAERWLAEAQTVEVADVLCHALLRKCGFAYDVAMGLLGRPDATDMNRYAALRLLLNLVVTGAVGAAETQQAAIDEQRRACSLTQGVAAQLLSEFE